MGKKKTQRKQWRKIDTQEVDDAIEQRTREERQGLVVDGIPDADLFFVDKAPDAETVAAVEQGKLPRKLAARERQTRAQAILQASQRATPVSRDVVTKRRGKGAASAAAGAQALAPRRAAKRGNDDTALVDLWAEDDAAAPPPVIPVKKIRRRGPTHVPAAPAVTVDAPGCSFNPDRELHQDVVAAAVAAELKKATDRELLPTAPLRTVDYGPETDELQLLQVEAEEDDEEEDAGSGEEGEKRGSARAARQKTQKDRNRQERRRVEEEGLERRRREKRQRRDLSQLGAISADVEGALAAQQARLARRHADAEERAAAEPPRLGRHRFEALPLQVLATRELQAGGGSLRRLKPTPVLARERFKSLQRRGIIEPRRRVVGKTGRRVEFIHGQRGERAEARQAEVEALRQSKKKKGKKGGGAE